MGMARIQNEPTWPRKPRQHFAKSNSCRTIREKETSFGSTDALVLAKVFLAHNPCLISSLSYSYEYFVDQLFPCPWKEISNNQSLECL